MKAKETRAAVQKLLGVTPDTEFGPNTHTAYHALGSAGADSEWPPLKPNPEPDTPVTDKFDERTEKNLATLLPPVANRARSFLAKAKAWLAPKGVEIKVISGTRTYAEQDALYAQGRSKPGPRVTNARGGYSNHNFSLAFDVGLFKGGDYLEDSPYYAQISSLAKSVGLLWGGDWKSIKDEPHYEYNPNGYTLAQLRDRKASGQELV